MQLNKKGELPIMLMMLFPIILIIVFILIARSQLFTLKMDLKGYAEIATDYATDNAMTLMDDTTSQQFCVILNDNSKKRLRSFEATTEMFMQNLEIGYGTKQGEVTITSIGTEDDNNAWNWQQSDGSWGFGSITPTLKRAFKEGKADMVIKGYYRPNYLDVIPDIWEGMHFTVVVRNHCVVTES